MARTQRDEVVKDRDDTERDPRQPGAPSAKSNDGTVSSVTGALIECLQAVDHLEDEETLRVMRSIAAYRGIAL